MDPSSRLNSRPKFLIAAALKSSGKTTVSVGLARAYSNRGMSVQTFKKGPDYIDPLWLEQATARPCYNLDFNAQSEAEIVETFSNNLAACELAIVETNKGLFDGVAVDGSDSNAQLAKILDIPILLVVDTIGMTRGIAPLLYGYSCFDPQISISGIILNKTGGSRHEGKLRAAIEHYSDIPVLGSVGRDENLFVAERHLGLTTPGDKSGAQPLVERLAETMEQSLDLDGILNIANSRSQDTPAIASPAHHTRDSNSGITIAIARDEAFGFYYPDDLEALAGAGAKLQFFSTLNDSQLPQADGLFIGGGFPETHLRQLEANQSMRRQIKSAIENGLPTYGECGGLMYLSRSIEWSDQSARMVGVIDGDCLMHQRPQGRGFARLECTREHPWHGGGGKLQNTTYRVHEFHYASIENLPENTRYAFNVKRGHGIDGSHDGIVIDNLLANFCHFRHTRQSPWAQDFVNFVRKCREASRYT
jgi:cobyrinic acid a,c-diamide synthase